MSIIEQSTECTSPQSGRECGAGPRSLRLCLEEKRRMCLRLVIRCSGRVLLVVNGKCTRSGAMQSSVLYVSILRSVQGPSSDHRYNDRQRRIETSASHLRRRGEAVKKPARSSLISANCVCTQRRQVEDLLSPPSGASLPIAEKTATARESPRVRKEEGTRKRDSPSICSANRSMRRENV